MLLSPARPVISWLLAGVLAASLVAVAAPDAAADPATGPAPSAEIAPEEMDDRVLVWTQPGSDAVVVLADHGLTAEPALPGVTVRAAAVVPGTARDRAAELARDPRVEAAMPDVLLTSLRAPDDPAWPAQWGPRQVGADRAWELTVGRSGPVVAVVDSGVDAHADLPASAILPGYNALDGSSSTGDGASDRHGTSVATVIAARGDNGEGTAGYCWNCRIMPIKVVDDTGGGLFELLNGVRWAARNGADVINLSLVIGDRPVEQQQWPPQLLTELESAFAEVEQRGVVAVAAAGNHGTTGTYYPAALPTVVSVAATTPTGSRAGYSGYGDGVDLAAPGCHVVVPVSAREFCGTSSAAPAVAGTIALLRAMDATRSPAQLRDALFATAAPVGFVRHGLLGTAAAVDRLLPAGARLPAVALTGDFTGDGVDTPGWFRDGVFYLRLSPGGGPPDQVIRYGRPGDLPLIGDWNGDGRDTLGVVRDGRWFLTDELSGGPGTIAFTYGRVTQGDIPLVGDWDGDGRDTIGIVREGDWHLRDDLAGGNADRRFRFGRVTRGDVPLIGDWNADGRDTVAVVRGATWYLRDQLAGGDADRTLQFGTGAAGEQQLVTDRTGDGRSTPVVVQDHMTWHIRDSLTTGPADQRFRALPWR